MEDGVLRDFGDGVGLVVSEVFDLREEDVLGLVLSEFVVGLEDFVFDFDFL
jgi:hypothetical protein